jgi:nitrite reductase/ring-hydroxylating ferredoxin subunit
VPDDVVHLGPVGAEDAGSELAHDGAAQQIYSLCGEVNCRARTADYLENIVEGSLAEDRAVRRREALAGGGCCVLWLAGCGSTSTTTGGGGRAVSTAETSTGVTAAQPLIALAALRVGDPVVVRPTNGFPAVLVRVGPESVHAFDATCPHMGCTVEILDGDLVCPCHNSRFVPTTGRLIRGPARRSLTPVAVRITAGYVWRG